MMKVAIALLLLAVISASTTVVAWNQAKTVTAPESYTSEIIPREKKTADPKQVSLHYK